jgi:hypothetical protein
LAGEIRVKSQVVVPELLMAVGGDAVKAMAVFVIKGRAQA